MRLVPVPVKLAAAAQVGRGLSRQSEAVCYLGIAEPEYRENS